MEIFLYFADISDMREKRLHITDIWEYFLPNFRGTKNPALFQEAGFLFAMHHLFSFIWIKE
jgi:hypothetical protein